MTISTDNAVVADGKVTDMARVTDAILSKVWRMKQQPTVQVSCGMVRIVFFDNIIFIYVLVRCLSD